jgi:hypothetical protein
LVGGSLVKHRCGGRSSISGCVRIYLRIKHDPGRSEYMDLALTPVMDDETQTRELFRSQAAQTCVGPEHHLDKFRRNLQTGGPACGGRARVSVGCPLTRAAQLPLERGRTP